MNARQSHYHQIQLQKILVDSPIGSILLAIGSVQLESILPLLEDTSPSEPDVPLSRHPAPSLYRRVD